MDIKKIDKNFLASEENSDGLKYYDIPCDPFDLYGVYYEKQTNRFVRLPSEIADIVSDGVRYLNSNTAGGRVRFSTNSERISVKVKYQALTAASHFSVLGGSGFVLLEERGDKTVFVFSYMPNYHGNDKENKTDNGYSVTKKVNDGAMRNYILYFPNYNDVSSLSIGLDETAAVGHGKKYRDIKPVLYYGSSITQGACASRADNDYPAYISKWSNVDFYNFGFSGWAFAEEKLIKYLATVDCSIFVCDYDFNAPDPDFLEKTHYNLYKTYRAIRKDTPIVFISNPDTDENYMRAKERVKIVRKTYEAAVGDGDKNVYFIDGKELYGKNDRENCTVDAVHPNDLGFYKMAKRVYKTLKPLIEKTDKK